MWLSLAPNEPVVGAGKTGPQEVEELVGSENRSESPSLCRG